MTPKRVSIAAAATAAVALLVVGLIQLGGSSSSTPPSGLTLAQMRQRLSGSPPALAALHAQANEIIAGGLPALRARLAALRGTPVVINKWASWREPSREEFGVFQRVSVSRGGRSRSSGRLRRHGYARARVPALVPAELSELLRSERSAGASITGSAFTPVTVFINRSGSKFILQGPFSSVAKLEQAVSRYALDA